MLINKYLYLLINVLIFIDNRHIVTYRKIVYFNLKVHDQ